MNNKQTKEDLLKGLNSQEVEDSRSKSGSNKLKEKEYDSFLRIALGNLKEPMCGALLICLCIVAVFCVLGFVDFGDPLGITAALILASVTPAWQAIRNQQKEKELERLKDEIMVKTKREGVLTDIMINDLVVGDVVKLQAGDKIPADGYLIEGNIKVSLAAHNGESEDVKRTVPEDILTYSLPTEITEEALKSKHNLYRESVVTSGTGFMVITEVGDNTRYGKTIANVKVDEVTTPLQYKLGKLGAWIAKVGIIGGIAASCAFIYLKIFKTMTAVQFIAGLTSFDKDIYMAIVDAVILAVAIVIVAVPEGLPMMIGSVLAMNTSKLLKDNILVRKLNGIEAAGSINIQFTDKTGTLTKGELEVVEVKCFTEETDDITSVSALLKSITETSVDTKGNYIGGNFTEVALLRFSDKITSNKPILKKSRELPFDSANKFSLSCLEDSQVIVKGAPDFILDYHTSPTEKEYVDNLADKAMRTIALVRIKFPTAKVQDEFQALLDEENYAGLREFIQANHETLCIFGIRDEYRESAKEAIALARKAHVQVVMVTGDNIKTATAIARDLDMLSDTPNPVIIDSVQLNAMTNEEVIAKLADLRVVARAQPQDKQRLVKIAQSQNLVCGMTGDGANDAPALKQADVGFAMGSGTEVAKEAGDVTIIDDNFLSVVKTINYGRTVFNSIRKFINYQMIINFSAIALAVVGPFIGIDEPLTVTQLLLINMIMDTLAALALCGEPCLEEYMERKPVPRTEAIITKDMAIHIGVATGLTSIICLAITYVAATYLNAVPSDTYMVNEVKTMIFTTFIFIAIFTCFVVRGREHKSLFKHMNENKLFLKVQGVILAVLFLLIYVLGDFIGLIPLELDGIIISAELGFIAAGAGHLLTKW